MMQEGGEGKNLVFLMPVPMQSLVNQILTGLLQNKMLEFHQVRRHEELYPHGSEFCHAAKRG